MNAFDDALDVPLDTDEERQAARARLADDPAFAAAFARATALLRACRDDLDARVPSPAFVLDALEAQGCSDALTTADRALLAAARLAFDAPDASAVRARCRADAESFSQCWAEAFASRSRIDRSAVRGARSARTSRRWVWRASVGVALVAFAALAVLIVQRDQSMTTIQVAQGETVRLVALADGSTARLYPGSTLRYADPSSRSPFARAVSLEGRALFDVSTGDPFTVRTDEARVTVLGTTFAVEDDAQQTRVTLIDGELVVASAAAPGQPVRLAPGEQSLVRGGALPSTPVLVDAGEALGWSGILILRDAPMAEVARRVADRFGLEVRVSDALASERVTATFGSDETARGVVEALALTLGADVADEGGALVVR
jgi:transmembrane sensor